MEVEEKALRLGLRCEGHPPAGASRSVRRSLSGPPNTPS
jgi:hypothetical protein